MEIEIDPKDRWVKSSDYARAHGLSPRHFMNMRREHPDAWPSECLRAHTTFYGRVRDFDAFVAECARRQSAQPERFAEYGSKGGRRRART